MAGQEGAEPVPVAEKNILYDRLVPVEWPDSVEILVTLKRNNLLLSHNTVNDNHYFGKRCLV